VGRWRAACAVLPWIALSIALSIASGRAQDGVWTGAWDTSWPNGSARLVLQQQGNRVEGTYRLYDGHLSGTVSSNRLEGTWTEGAQHGWFVFVLGPFGDGFAGRFDGDAWWTGARAGAGALRLQTRDDTPQDTLRSFVVAGNATAAGLPDIMADAVQLVDFGAEAPPPDARRRLALTRALYAAIDLTTFQVWALPDPAPDARAVTYTLAQAGTQATLPLTLRQTPDGRWRIAAPQADALAAATRALLARDGGRAPVAEDMRALRTPRAAFRSFIAGMMQWRDGGAQRVLDTMDLSQIREGYRADQGLLQAQYMLQVIDRVGAWQWQAIPDDPASRQPYVFFTHPAGQIVIAPLPDGDRTRWRFTAGTVNSQLRLFLATKDMPPPWGMPAIAPAAGLFAFRARIAAFSPVLLATSVIAGLENWQIVAIVVTLAVAAVAMVWGVPLFVRLFAIPLRLLGQDVDAALQRRLVWPLRLLVIALIWYKFSRRLGLAGPGVPALDSLMDVLAAVGLALVGLPVVDTVARGLYGRASRLTGSLDEILISLTAGLLKLALVVAVALAAAEAFDVPVSGIVAGLGIGGLAVAFASKETLSNLFGAGILLADRPFRNGDVIAVGDVTGQVEAVGIRSTRIRTPDDTLVVMPNGKLSDALINNFGARRYRLFRTRVTLGHGATRDAVDRFTARLRALVDGQPGIAAEKTQLGVSQLSNDGIEIELVCYFRAQTGAEERAARHDLLLQIMRLAEEQGVRFTGA
jgi:small-conductance mechanosensitive channel